MPTYEYVCAKCDREFEFFQPISAQALTTCPKELCKRKPWGKGKVKRLIGAGAGLLFKGSGFYITDYRSENYKQGAKNEAKTKETKSDSTKSDSPKSDSKSAGKTASSTPSTKGKGKSA